MNKLLISDSIVQGKMYYLVDPFSSDPFTIDEDGQVISLNIYDVNQHSFDFSGVPLLPSPDCPEGALKYLKNFTKCLVLEKKSRYCSVLTEQREVGIVKQEYFCDINIFNKFIQMDYIFVHHQEKIIKL